MRELSVRLLTERTGKTLAEWNQLIANEAPPSEAALREWLTKNGVAGYAQSMLVMERFGYPDYFLSSAAELIDAQYAACPRLRPVFDAVCFAAASFGDVTIQARKTYVSLLTPRRTFARIQPNKNGILIVALRLSDASISARLTPSKLHESTPFELRLTSIADLDAEGSTCLRAAILQNL